MERVNQCLETYLHYFVHACPSKWIKWLSLAEFWYNSPLHSTLGRSPFEVLYGHALWHFGLSAEVVGSDVPALNPWLSKRALMQDLVKQHLHAQAKMKHQFDKCRSKQEFTVGDWIFLKIQPYVRSSLAQCSCQKLAFWFFGPF